MPPRSPDASSTPPTPSPTTTDPFSLPEDPQTSLPQSPLFRPTSPPQLDTPPEISSESQDESLSPFDPDDDPGSSPRSTGSPSRARFRGLKASIKGAIQTAGGIAHQLLTREGTPERDNGLYLPDDDDVKAISEPLAGLASRRLPEGASNPDVTDLIGLVVGLAGYAIKQQLKRAELLKLQYLEGTVKDQADDVPQPVDA